MPVCPLNLEFASFLRLSRDLSSDQKVVERDNAGIQRNSCKVWVVGDQKPILH